MSVTILTGHVMDRLAELPADSVHCVITSPPYFRQRDYGIDGQIGQEETPTALAGALSAVFASIKRVLRADGCIWLNMGDSYAAGGNGGGGSLAAKRRHWTGAHKHKINRRTPCFKEKDITLTPFVVAERLRADGWYLRSVIIWDKQFATEPPRLDRPPSAHEYVFLLTKAGINRVRDPDETWFLSTVWTVRPQPSFTGHPAAMPEELVRRCLVCSTARGDLVLDPFGGAGTTGLVADRLGRDAILIELNPDYAAMARRRIEADAGLFAAVG